VFSQRKLEHIAAPGHWPPTLVLFAACTSFTGPTGLLAAASADFAIFGKSVLPVMRSGPAWTTCAELLMCTGTADRQLLVSS
jgi:hypothetical protein